MAEDRLSMFGLRGWENLLPALSKQEVLRASECKHLPLGTPPS